MPRCVGAVVVVVAAALLLGGCSGDDDAGADVTTTTSTTAAPTTTTTAAATHTVVAGDTLSAIATRYGTTVDELVSRNGLADPNALTIGQVLQLPTSATTTSTP